MWRRVVLHKFTDISETRTASIFRTEEEIKRIKQEKAKHTLNMKVKHSSCEIELDLIRVNF
jgi:hypothetical protein